MTINPIAWAIFQSRGGWKNTFVFTGGYAALVVGGIMLTAINSDMVSMVYSRWTTILLGIQSLILLAYAPTRVSSTIRQDLVGKMIESHRLMPCSPVGAVM